VSAQPRYPVYIPSKGRADAPYTIRLFSNVGIDFRIVVEPSQEKAYSQHGQERLLILPEDGKGLVYARNWIKDHAVSEGYKRHWQFDDDITCMLRMYRGYRLRCPANVALAAAEDFVERYENVALAAFNSQSFLPCSAGTTKYPWPPFLLNHRCYTSFLMLNSLPNRWRQRYNEDTDMTLQVLADGWCTILFNAFMIDTPTTMTYTGGQTDIYVDDGRLHMARQLERVWPGVVSTKRRFRRPQHYINGEWRKFDNQLKRRADFDPSKLPTVDEYGMNLVEVSPTDNARLRELLQATQGEEFDGSR